MTPRIKISFLLLLLTLHVGGQVENINQKLRQTAAQFGQAVVEITYPGRTAADRLSKSFSVDRYHDGKLTIVLSPPEVDDFIRTGYGFDLLPGKPFPYTSSDMKGLAAYDFQSYPTFSQYDSLMRSLATGYPAICKLDTIGFSIRGKLILALKISDNVNIDENEPEVFYTSSMHGDELGGYVLMMRLADYLARNYSNPGLARTLVQNLEIWINPLSNPDGTYGTGNTITAPVRANANGIDLNRNFPDPFYPGNVPEKENIDMIKFLRAHHFVLSANFHGGSEVVNYPWDRWLSKFHADDAWFNNISRAYADTVHNYSSGYLIDLDNGVTRGAVWYVIYRGRQDFVTWELQGREVTIELDDIKQTPPAQLELLWQHNYRSLLRYLESATFGIQGTVQNNVNQQPVPAKIFIQGYDKDSSHVYSDTLDGTFRRYLMPGTWNLTFSSRGYRDTIITTVVTARQKTELNVRMTPLTTKVDTADPDHPFVYPNPSSGAFYCIAPPDYSGQVVVTLISTSGTVTYRSMESCSPGVPFLVSADRLASGTYILSIRSVGGGRVARARVVILK
ncbi:MAG: M14 family zinc carboxypeptidase [Bacteroidales bacterium]